MEQKDKVMKPLIGITSNIETRTSNSFDREFNDLNTSYIKAVLSAGGVPVIIPNGLKEDDLIALVNGLDGFLFSGGVDVDPSYYDMKDDGTLGKVTPARDATEIMLIKYLMNNSHKPIMGICRGLQIINVASGGTLIMDLPSAGKNRHSFVEKQRFEFTHEIVVKDDTRLKKLLKDENRVNSFHHQAIDKLGKGLIVSAYSKEDNVIEAIEAADNRYLLAVQWHPEELIDNAKHFALFAELIRQCKNTSL